jgi:ubiquinone/menaquinone biosynthesis C-methylase UbiE
MDEIGVRTGMTVADVGAGDGYFTFYLSRRVGETGKVYASDIDDSALQIIRNRCRQDGITNIVVISGEEDDPLLPVMSVDLVLMVNTIHLVKNPTVLLENIAKSLKRGGSLVIVQWDAARMRLEMKDWDPEDQTGHTLRTNLRKIYDAAFEVVDIKEFLPMQRIYICQPAEKI